MLSILKTIATETNGKSFGTRKLCHDDGNYHAINYDDHQKFVWKQRGETVDYKESIDLESRAIELITQDFPPLFNYFLDGSRRTYKVDDIEYSGQIFPVIAGQVAVGTCKRSERQLEKHRIERSFLLVLPDEADKDGQYSKLFFSRLLDTINALPVLHKHGIQFCKILTYFHKKDDSDKLEDKGIAKVQEYMVEIEKDLVAQLVKENALTPRSYLLKDGSLEYKSMRSTDERRWARIRSNYRFVVGVSKSFNPENCRDHKNKIISSKIAKLPLHHRTPVQMYEADRVSTPDDPVFFAVWYVRIRAAEHTNSPYDGILKVEKVLVTNEEMEKGIDSDTVDTISANLINEKRPVCWGSDTRWANHLYPVYLTERFLKSRFLSSRHFLNLF